MNNERIVSRIISASPHKNTQARMLIQRRVAAYARVSTNSPDQLMSNMAQIDYYTQYICARENWVFAGIYTDEGISGTSTKRREGFARLVQDAIDGKIDLIITKSISRFARNTVDTLMTIRKLKEHNVEVYFEKENLYTFDSKGEVMITMLSSLAQEESRSISENTAWGIRKRMADGKFNLPYVRFLGYEKGKDGRPQIVESEAAVVRHIYGLFIKGDSFYHIAKQLEAEGIPSPSGKSVWQYCVIESILTNEKYMGDAILQKTYISDYLTKKQKPNQGELPQYHVKRSHPGIISKDVFDYVQEEIKHRGFFEKPHSTIHVLSNKIVCGRCGGYYGRRIWHATNKYRAVVWQCRKRWQKGSPCHSPHFYDMQVKDAFMKVMAMVYMADPSIRETCRQMTIPTVNNRYRERLEQVEAFFDNIDMPYDFDDDLFCVLVTQIYVESAHTLKFELRDGTVVPINI